MASHQQAFAQSIVDNIINGNTTTARGQLEAASFACMLTVVELMAYHVTEQEIAEHGTLLGASIAKLRRFANKEGE